MYHEQRVYAPSYQCELSGPATNGTNAAVASITSSRCLDSSPCMHCKKVLKSCDNVLFGWHETIANLFPSFLLISCNGPTRARSQRCLLKKELSGGRMAYRAVAARLVAGHDKSRYISRVVATSRQACCEQHRKRHQGS